MARPSLRTYRVRSSIVAQNILRVAPYAWHHHVAARARRRCVTTNGAIRAPRRARGVRARWCEEKEATPNVCRQKRGRESAPEMIPVVVFFRRGTTSRQERHRSYCKSGKERASHKESVVENEVYRECARCQPAQSARAPVPEAEARQRPRGGTLIPRRCSRKRR